MELNFYADAGHGWLKVNIKYLIRLGIHTKISHFSYLRKDYAYLEEDCDSSLFLSEAKKAGYEIKIKNHHCKGQSKIRSYNNY